MSSSDRRPHRRARDSTTTLQPPQRLKDADEVDPLGDTARDLFHLIQRAAVDSSARRRQRHERLSAASRCAVEDDAASVGERRQRQLRSGGRDAVRGA